MRLFISRKRSYENEVKTKGDILTGFPQEFMDFYGNLRTLDRTGRDHGPVDIKKGTGTGITECKRDKTGTYLSKISTGR